MCHMYIYCVSEIEISRASCISSANPDCKVLLGWQRPLFKQNMGLLTGIEEARGEGIV